MSFIKLVACMLSVLLLVHCTVAAHEQEALHDNVVNGDDQVDHNDEPPVVPVVYENFTRSEWLIDLNDSNFDTFLDEHIADHSILVFWSSSQYESTQLRRCITQQLVKM
jgi:hypothetical protein